jgi:hypothetical protein
MNVAIKAMTKCELAPNSTKAGVCCHPSKMCQVSRAYQVLRFSVFLRYLVFVQSSGEPFRIRYGTGEVVGNSATDVMSMGTPALTVDSQGFGGVYAASDDFVGASCDGLVVSASSVTPLSVHPLVM